MPFLCPGCQAPSLEITSRLELPPDRRSDEIALQIIACGNCGLRGLAIYEESRRGALDSESWSHWGYRAEGFALRSLAQRIRQCPDPRNPKCGCPVHREFRRTGPGSDWPEALPGVDWDNPFAIELG